MKRRKYSRIRKVISKGIFPEDRIIALAESGELKKIAEKAIKNSKDLGLPVTLVEESVLYRIMPDGQRIMIKDLQQEKSAYKRGHIFKIKAAS